MIAGARAQFPGHEFRPRGTPDGHGLFARFSWSLAPQGGTPVAGGTTLATGLNVPGGVGHFKVLEIIRASGGCALAVSEAEIGAALTQSWAETPWWLCTEAAACLAALPQLVEMRQIRRGERVVVVNTGSLEKYLGPAVRALI